MITTVMTTDKKEFREMIDKLNVMQKRVFSPDEVDYLTDCDGFEYLEFKQEDHVAARAPQTAGARGLLHSVLPPQGRETDPLSARIHESPHHRVLRHKSRLALRNQQSHALPPPHSLDLQL